MDKSTEFEQWIRNIPSNGEWMLEENYQTILRQANLFREHSGNLHEAQIVEAFSIVFQTAQAEAKKHG